MIVKCDGCGVEIDLKPNKQREYDHCPDCIKVERKRKREIYMNSTRFVDDMNKKALDKFGSDVYNDMAVCLCCEEKHGVGLRANDLTSHIIAKHMPIKDYKEKYSDVIRSKSYLKQQSERISGDKNPASGHDGSLSPFSEKFYLRKGYTAEESKTMAREKQKTKDAKGGSNTIEYWTKKGYTESEAVYKVKERQAVGSKENFIKRYGKEEGIDRWEKRQIKWQTTLNGKSDNEKEEINYKKGNSMRRSFLVEKHGNKKADDIIRSRMSTQSYSKISQELFKDIYSVIDSEVSYEDVHFAIKHSDGVYDSGKSDEYVVHTHNDHLRYLDFYIKSSKKCIEFDGDYYHSERFFKGNKERDAIREQEIIDTIDGIQILHVKECDYKKDKEKVIKECVEFLIGKGDNNE